MKHSIVLIEKVKKFPTDSGVYLMKNAEGVILYVGKAKNLKKRVLSYFQRESDNLRIEILLEKIKDIETILTKNEQEALLLERNLIKSHKPIFNILLKDDKEYPYLQLTLKSQAWPRILKVRKLKNNQDLFLGPYSNSKHLNNALRAALEIFPLVRCTESQFAQAKKPCHYYHMKQCLGPCAKPVDKNVYDQMVKDTFDFLLGKRKDIEHSIKDKMVESAKREDFELAAIYRDQLFALEKSNESQTVVFKNIKNADVISYYQKETSVGFCVLKIRNNAICDHYYLFLPQIIDCKQEALDSFLERYYEQNSLPFEIIIPEEVDFFKNSQEKSTQIIIPKKGEKIKALELAHKNAAHYFETEFEKHELVSNTLVQVQQLLNIDTCPNTMECFDISNQGSENIVASNVCFIDGKPSKKHYRIYKIKSLNEGEQNDFKSIYEVVLRRCKKAIKENSPLPDIMLIDGGKGQLSSAQKALEEFPNLKTNLVSIAKSHSLKPKDYYSRVVEHSSERLFQVGLKNPITLKENTLIYQLFTQLRNEAHRFAITFHRKERLKKIKDSKLKTIPGIGNIIYMRLLQHFGGIEKIKSASLEELEAVKGVSRVLALNIKAYL